MALSEAYPPMSQKRDMGHPFLGGATNSRFPEGMTERKATATAKAGYGAVGGLPSHVSKARHGAPISWWCDEQQIPGGNDRKKGNGNCKGGIWRCRRLTLPCLKSETWGTHFLVVRRTADSRRE